MGVTVDVRKLSNTELAELLKRAGEMRALELARWDRVRRLMQLAPIAAAKGDADFAKFHRPARESTKPVLPNWSNQEKEVVREEVAAAKARGETLAIAYEKIHERLPNRSVHAIQRQHKLSSPRAVERLAARSAERDNKRAEARIERDKKMQAKRDIMAKKRSEEMAWMVPPTNGKKPACPRAAFPEPARLVFHFRPAPVPVQAAKKPNGVRARLLKTMKKMKTPKSKRITEEGLAKILECHAEHTARFLVALARV